MLEAILAEWIVKVKYHQVRDIVLKCVLLSGVSLLIGIGLTAQQTDLKKSLDWYDKARVFASTYQEADSVYIYYNLAKEQFIVGAYDSLLFYCNNGLIEWHLYYGENIPIRTLLKENESLVHDDISQVILNLDYCKYYSTPTNYNSDSVRYYAQRTIDLALSSDDTIHYIVGQQVMVQEYLRHPMELPFVPKICEKILSMRYHNHETESLAVATDIDLSQYYILSGQPDKAIPILRVYTDNKLDYEVEFLIWVNEYLEQAYLNKRAYRQAHLVSRQLKSLSEEKAQKVQEQSLKEIEVIYQLQQTQQRLNATQEIATLNQTKLIFQKYLIYSLVVGSISLIGFIWLAWRYQRKKALQSLAHADSQKKMANMKNAFFTNIAHEIRTPLTIINGMSKRILGYPKEKELIRRNANYILSLVDQVLDLSKYDQGLLKLYPKRHNVVQVIAEEVVDHQSLAREKLINLSFTSDLDRFDMTIDADRLRQICTNLLSNAIKYTPEHGSVSMHLNQKNDGIEIKCKDSGIGISSDELDQIFERYYRSNRHYASGTGIGLSLVRELVDLMGGSINVTSQEDIGTQFTVIIPK